MNRRGTIATTLCALAMLAASSTTASEIDNLIVARSGDAYTIDTAVLLPADADHVRAILASPDLLPELNGRIQSVQALASTEPRETRLRIVSRRCVMIFCRDYGWVQAVRVDDAGDVRVRFEPGPSSVREGEILYRVDPVSPGRARVEVSARIVPSVALPPLIGPALMRSTLADDMAVWSANIVRLSRDAMVRDRVLVARSASPVERRETVEAVGCTGVSFC